MVIEPNILFHDRYRLIELKGRGSYGEVWLARDEQLDNMEVAVKIYIPLDERGIKEFGSEYRNTYGLSHPSLLRAYHYEMCGDRPYLVMPYCPGAATNYIGNIDEPKMWQFIRDVASGLAYLHGKDILHHDIKPDNILEDANGHFVISDFGISVKMRSTLRRNSNRQFNSNTLGGSMAYMGPEMFASHAESVKATDIWALGATLYEMATGELPFFGQGGAMMLNGAEVDREALHYSDSLNNTILGCLAKETWDRPQAYQLVERANAALSGRPIDVATPPVSDTGDFEHPWKGQVGNDPRSTVKLGNLKAGNRSNDPHSTVKYDNHSNEPLNYANTPNDNGNAGGTIKEGQNGAPITNDHKKSKAWLWILLVLLLLGGGGGATWIVLGNQKKADDNSYAKCHTANDFRNYIKDYPEGRNVQLARTQLNKLVTDSINQAQRQAEALAQAQNNKPDPKPNNTETIKVPQTTPQTNDDHKDLISKPKTDTPSPGSTPKAKKPRIEEEDNDDLFLKPRKTKKEYGNGIVYEGYAIPGTESKEGQGTLREPYGVVYTGNWKDNKRNGRGKQVFRDGAWYEGNWKDDKIDGYGEYHYKNNEVYKGYFKNGKWNGQGTYYDAYGNIKESGYYVNGVKQ